jgi:uncharacterized protein YajQ (UPF0234 family)
MLERRELLSTGLLPHHQHADVVPLAKNASITGSLSGNANFTTESFDIVFFKYASKLTNVSGTLRRGRHVLAGGRRGSRQIRPARLKLASRPRRYSTGTPPPALATIGGLIPAILASRIDPFRGFSTVADSHSFDVVSEINQAEMHNAIVQAQHEIAVRFDFKGTRASIEFNKKDNKITILADHKGQLETVIQVVKEKMARRSVPVGALRRGKVEDATHDTVRETLSLHSGIETDDARKMIKDIKQLKIKVQAQIMEDKIRVTAKKIDDLQAVIAHLKAHGPEYPLQFVNFA